MRPVKLIAAVLCSMLLAGCMSTLSLDDYGYVMAIGIDRGEQKKYKFSLMMQREQNESGSQSSKGGSQTVSCEGDSLFDAMNTLETGLPYELNFTRVNMMVFSYEIAKDGYIKELLDTSVNAIRLRQSVKLMVARDSADEYLNNLTSEDEPNVARIQSGILKMSRNYGTVPVISYASFIESTLTGRFDSALGLVGVDKSAAKKDDSSSGGNSSGSSDAESSGDSGSSGSSSDSKEGEDKKDTTTTGMQRTGGMASYAEGAALFNGYELTGVINGHDTQMLLIANGEFRQGHFEYTDSEGMVVFHLRTAKKPDTEFSFDAGARAHTYIKLICNIEQDTSRTAEKRWSQGLKGEVEKRIASEIERVFIICRELGSDVFGYGVMAYRQINDEKDFIILNWEEVYGNMDAGFTVELVLSEKNIVSHME